MEHEQVPALALVFHHASDVDMVWCALKGQEVCLDLIFHARVQFAWPHLEHVLGGCQMLIR